MHAFTVGISSARFEACKRGVAANYAAILACTESLSVCVLDADPRSCDVGNRLGVTSTSLRRFVRPKVRGDVDRLDAGTLPRLAYPPLHVLPVDPAYVDVDYGVAYEAAMDAAQAAFDVVVVDLPVGAGRPGPTLDSRMVDRLDVLVLALTPDRTALAATLRHVELFAEAVERGSIAPHLRLAVVVTGDEGSTMLDPADVAERLGDVCVGEVPQCWGRALPNLGFGPTIGIPILDDAIARLHRSVVESAADSRLFGVTAPR